MGVRETKGEYAPRDEEWILHIVKNKLRMRGIWEIIPPGQSIFSAKYNHNHDLKTNNPLIHLYIVIYEMYISGGP